LPQSGDDVLIAAITAVPFGPVTNTTPIGPAGAGTSRTGGFGSTGA